MGVIKLSGSQKCITANPSEIFLIKEGSVLVYIVSVSSGRMLRSVFVCQLESGVRIPTLSVKGDNNRSFHLLLVGEQAELEIKQVQDDEEKGEVRASFLKAIKDIPKDLENAPFSEQLVGYYNNELKLETKRIENLHEERIRVSEKRNRLILSMFDNKHLFDLEIGSGSILYDAVNIYCRAKDIEICPYREIKEAYGDDCDIMDISRASNFVCRKITLQKGWYKINGEAFIGFNKANHSPVICMPTRLNRYEMYDLETGQTYIVGDIEASFLEDSAYIGYAHLPGRALSIRDVAKFGIAKIRKADVAAYLILFLFTTLVGLLLPVLNQEIYDTLIPLGRFKSIIEVGGVIFACMIGNAFFDIVKNLSSFRSVKAMEYSIVSATYERIFKLPQKFIESFGTMELASRVNSVIGVFSSTVSSGVTAVIGVVLGFFYLWRMFSESSALAFRALILSVISAVTMYAFGRARMLHEKEKLVASTKANGMLYGFISGILKLKVSGSENRSLYEFQKVNVDALSYDVRSTKIQNIGNIVANIISVFCTGFIYFTIVKKKQTLTIGDYAAFSSAYGMFMSAVNKLVSFFLTLAGLLPVVDRVKPIYEQEIESSGIPQPLGRLKGNIDIENLNFSYDKDEVGILSDINMHISAGEFIGIVGPTGCGKSTLLKCLLGFESLSSGKIMYDQREISSLDICELRRRIGTVLQDGKLITGNIYTNVTLASPNLNAESVESILKEVGMYDDVLRMPMGIFTPISEGGGTVSGGQAQRILIARALANDPSIMLLDEATSALDNVTQQKVCESLKNRNITRIMIAHRLSTVVNCDRIYVMDKGKIAEYGSYTELMEKKGLFYELAKRQKVNE